jgi:hypothetical protein
MTWFKVDDTFYRSRKVRKLGDERVACVGLWTLCGGWSADNLSDGFVPWEVVEDWDDDRALSKRLVVAGLWVEVEVDGEPGVQFHDWEDWQPTSDQVKQRRKADAERRARWRETQRKREAAKREPSHRESQRDASQCDAPRDAQVYPLRDPDVHESDQDLFGGIVAVSRRDSRDASRQESRPGSALPDPTRPDPSTYVDGEEKPRTRKRPRTRIPDTWRPNPNHIAQAQRLGLDVDQQARQFRNHAEMNDRILANWDAGFRQWLDKAQEFRPRQLRVAAGGHTDPNLGRFYEQ